MKAFKIIFIIFAVILSSFYLAFLFIIPNYVKINNYNLNIGNIILKIEDISLKTDWNLSVGAKAAKLKLYYKNGEKFTQIDNIELRLSTIHLLAKKIKLNKIAIGDGIVRLGIENDGTFTIEKFLPKQEENSDIQQELPYGLQFSNSMPDIYVKKYSISFIDNSTQKFYTAKGNNLKISDFDITKKIKIQTIGSFQFDKKEQFKYDIALSSILPDFTSQKTKKQESSRINFIDIFENIRKLNLTADIKTDLKLTGSFDNLKTDGWINLTQLSVKVKGKLLPYSAIALKFKENKIKINSALYTAEDEKALLEGFFRYGKKPYVDLQVSSDKIDLSNLFAIVNSLLPIVGIDDIDGISANGLLKADFNIKSDFKNINSDGYLKISDANIYYNVFNVALKNLNSNIDFRRNQINIKESNANFNGSPISISGAIDSNAYANISVNANKVPLKGLLASLGQIKILKENDIKKGQITINATLKGRLNKSKPQIDVLLENLSLTNKPYKTNLSLANAKIKAITNGTKINGSTNINGLKLYLAGMPVISIPESMISFDEKDITLDKVYFYLNNSKINVLGKINDYSNKKININIVAKGLLNANDMKLFLDKNMRQSVESKGKLPLIVKISGTDKVQDINAQILANNTNYFSLIKIDSLNGKTSLANFSAKILNNELKINDASMYSLTQNNGLTSDFKSNIGNSRKVISAKGTINNLNAQIPSLQGLYLNIPNQTTISIPGLTNSSALIKGEVSINGKINNPEITGHLIIPSLRIPSLYIGGKNINITLAKDIITVNCTQANIADSVFDLSTTISNNFSKEIRIKSLNVNAGKFNLDTFAKALQNMPQNSNAPGTNTGIRLSNGKMKIATFTSGGIQANNVETNLTINNNVLKLSEIKGNSYGGEIVGTIIYNILYGKIKVNFQGRGLSAEPAFRAFSGTKNLVHGFLDFDAFDLSTVAYDQTQMLQSLTGHASFRISDGQMGNLGKLENLLYAQNILTNNIFKITLGAVAKAVSIKKTGDFKYIKGKLNFRNGWTIIESIQTSGSAMSMYITGKYNLLNNNANVIILGRLSNDVVSLLGPIGDFSVSKIISSIPKIGAITNSLIEQMTTNPSGENLTMLPDLTPKQSGETREFKVCINGNVEKTSSVKYFKWLSTPTTTTQNTISMPKSIEDVKNEAQNKLKDLIKIPEIPQSTSQSQQKQPQKDVADFINSLPDLLN